MIKYFAVKNFRSIKDDVILECDMELNDDTAFVAHPTIGIAGANASGKTTVLTALNFTLWFMQSSFFRIEAEKNIPIEPFFTQRDLPTHFHLIFCQQIAVDDKEKLIDFEYELILTKQEVISEKLNYYPYNRKRKIFDRTAKNIFGKNIKKIPLDNLRKNSSIVSYAAQFESQYLIKACRHYKFNFGKKLIETEEFVPFSLIIKQLYVEKKKDLVNFLKIADTGINNIEFEETNIFEPFKFIHTIDGKTARFVPNLESLGTMEFFDLLPSIIEALEQGSLLILDEIELHLHPNLVAYLIGLFQNEATNPKNAQLIFSFHNTAFMDILEPTQLWFTEKDDNGQTSLFSASDFEDIKNLHQRSLEKLYRIGRFGAVPRGL